ncbi:hypothetical protein TNCV_320941 [Trichonephila clavipes]|nr:hypothetical protein TNCV_320941 [Trichonephila clavipes]
MSVQEEEQQDVLLSMGYALPLLQWLLRTVSPYAAPDFPKILEVRIGLYSKKAKTSDIIETQNQFSGLLTNNEDTMDVVDPQEGTSSATSHPGVTAPQKNLTSLL